MVLGFDTPDQNYTGLGSPPPSGTDYFTEQFASGDDAFDLSYTRIMFTPNGSSYTACSSSGGLPTDPAGGQTLSLGDDDSRAVSLTRGMVSIYESSYSTIYVGSYSTIYVGSNGYIIFDGPSAAHEASLAIHFGSRRVSCLFDDLNPSASGTVSWREFSDRVVVTWQDVPEYSYANSNTFQIELYYDGRIQLAWGDVASADAIVGLSGGGGVPANFVETDLSAY
jgi:hypothetical protein